MSKNHPLTLEKSQKFKWDELIAELEDVHGGHLARTEALALLISIFLVAGSQPPGMKETAFADLSKIKS